MNNAKSLFLLVIFICIPLVLIGQHYQILSPDQRVTVVVENAETIKYSIHFNSREIISASDLGFEFEGEPEMKGGFVVLEANELEVRESWAPVVKLKRAVVENNYNEISLKLQERSGFYRRMDITFRVFNDGVGFRYKLFRSEHIGDREILDELTTFCVPGDPTAWIVEHGGYATSQEREYMKHPLSYVSDSTNGGHPLLMEYDNGSWVAITEANIDNYAAFYFGTKGTTNTLVTKLAPKPGDTMQDPKVSFDDDLLTPWRVIMLGDSPANLIESDIVRNLNEPCAIEDPSWIKPGKSAWDHWWSGDVKMEMPVIKEYIDFASEMKWEYMLVDWQWYGEFNKASADITTWAPQINIPEIIAYAKQKDVKIILWLYSTDVNRNSAYKKAFPLYHEWGVAGIKIDFMDRDDQEMVNWYHEIIKTAADNKLLVDFHGAYKPDGIIRTYPNMITREGVLGNEYYKFSDRMSPEHNVKLAFTRMLCGPMDYTPGAFLNVTREEFKNQVPTLVWNTRAAELSKFVIYESPLAVVCEHPKHVYGEPGAEFMKSVPVVWDETRFIDGHPSEYVAIARKSSDTWYLGVMNNSKRKTVELTLEFLDEDGIYVMESWSDTKKSDEIPTDIKLSSSKVKKSQSLKIELARNGGYVGVIREKEQAK